jgi:hypothetical protein
VFPAWRAGCEFDGKGAVMTTKLDAAKSKTGPSVEETAAKELVRLARDQGLSLTGPDGLLKQFTKTVLETALNQEMTEHLGQLVSRWSLGRPLGFEGTCESRIIELPHVWLAVGAASVECVPTVRACSPICGQGEG